MQLPRSTRILTFCVLAFSISLWTEAKSAHRTSATPSEDSASPAPQNPPASCPVTQVPAHPFVPPAPFSAKPGDGSFWFGNEELWTRLNTDGVWHGLHTESGYGDKLFWYSLGLSRKEEGKRRVMVTGRRRDAGAPPFVTYAHCCSSGNRPQVFFMIAGVDIPSPGCWEITGGDQTERVSFVVWVAP
jgi:hypothetical protein